MELVITYRFKWNNQFIGIISLKDPIIRTTPFIQHAIHHTEDEFDKVCQLLTERGFDYTYERFTHLYTKKAKP